MAFIERCSTTVESIQAMLVEYAFGKYDLSVVDKLFDALFASADLMVKQTISPNNSEELLQRLQARAALLPLLIMAEKEDCDGIEDLCREACKSSNATSDMFQALDNYLGSEHGTLELLRDEYAAKAQSLLNKINN